MTDLHRALGGHEIDQVPTNLWIPQAMRVFQSNQLAYHTPVDQQHGGWEVDPCWHYRGILDERRAGKIKLCYANTHPQCPMLVDTMSVTQPSHTTFVGTKNTKQHHNLRNTRIQTTSLTQPHTDKTKIDHERTSTTPTPRLIETLTIDYNSNRAPEDSLNAFHLITSNSVPCTTHRI